MYEPTDRRCQAPIWRTPCGRGLQSVALLLLFLLPGLATGQTAREFEDVFWESVECQSALQVQAYLEQYPTGAYVAAARACLEGQLGLDRAARVLVQQGLAAAGQEPGSADGLFGGERSRTREAIRAWQATKGLAATGYVTGAQAETLIALGWEAVVAAEVERQHAEAARQQAEEAEQRRKAEADDTAYAEAQRADTAAAYGAYLAAYPSGRHTVVARTRQQERTETERLAQLPREVRNSIGMEFVLIEAGTFEMGSPVGEEERDNNETLHTVTLSQPYYLGKYEVTQGQWKAVMGDHPSGSFYRSGYSDATYPVTAVFWDEVQDFIAALNQQEGVNVYRLPTEAEWEYAARGGQQSKGYRYAGSNNLGQVGWYESSWFSIPRPRPVGGKAPNELELYDMSGNVSEWVADWYEEYPRGSVTDPRGPSTGTYRIARGGDVWSAARDCRVANRAGQAPVHRHMRYANIGFRLAKRASLP